MGQDWIVVALDRRQKLYCLGEKLGEYLFDGYLARRLVKALAVPILPLVRSSLTPVSSTASNSNSAALPNSSKEAAGFEKSEHREFRLANTLPLNRKRDSGSISAQSEEKRQCSNPNAHGSPLSIINSTCGLLKLPNEILDVILQYLVVEEVFILGLQSQRLWNLARRHIQLYVASFCGQWAGSRIVCSGNYTEPTDYPPGIFSEAEKEVLKAGLSESDVGEDEELTAFVSQPLNIYNFASAMFDDYIERAPCFSTCLFLLAHRLGEWKRLPESIQSQIMVELEQYDNNKVFYPQESKQTWILRNLTTLEYVRPEAIAITSDCIRGPFIAGVGFGELVLSRICWSSEESCAMINEDIVYRGVWAGHRFDITTFERHRQSEKNTEWTDISEDAAAWIQKIWSTDYGENWRDEVLRGR